MTRTLNSLKTMVGLLNREPKRGKGLMSGVLAKAAKKERDLLRFVIMEIVAPDMLVPRSWSPADRNEATILFNREAPAASLIGLLGMLEEHAHKPTWRFQKTTKGLAKIDFNGIIGTVTREDFTDVTWKAIAQLLETGEIVRIGRCPICKLFFVKNRWWQKACNKSACRRKYDNYLSADRKAKARRRNRKK